jgi:hypothetical protein
VLVGESGKVFGEKKLHERENAEIFCFVCPEKKHERSETKRSEQTTQDMPVNGGEKL